MSSDKPHHILLTFLSDVKMDRDGSGRLAAPTSYTIGGRDCLTYTTNESAVCWLQDELKGNRVERIFTFVSNKVLQPLAPGKPGFAACLEEGGILPPEYIAAADGLNHFSFFRGRLEKQGLLENPEESVPMPLFTASEKDDATSPYAVYVPDGTNVDTVMMVVLKMAEKIRHYVATLPKEEWKRVILHADMTGGFRHAAMMMMAVLRLMQYQGIRTGSVVYSSFQDGRVYDLQSIYNLFEVTAGAEEFVNYGSVRVLKNYLQQPEIQESKDQSSGRLGVLLNAMEELDSAIRMSDVAGFEDATRGLSEAYRNFKRGYAEKAAKGELAIPIKDQVIDLILERIEAEYRDLMDTAGGKTDRWISVEWCIQHHYIQQALALFVELFFIDARSRKIIRVAPGVEKQLPFYMKNISVKEILQNPKWVLDGLKNLPDNRGKLPRAGREDEVSWEYNGIKSKDTGGRVRTLLELGNLNLFQVNTARESDVLQNIITMLQDFYEIRAYRNDASHGGMGGTSTRGGKGRKSYTDKLNDISNKLRAAIERIRSVGGKTSADEDWKYLRTEDLDGKKSGGNSYGAKRWRR